MRLQDLGEGADVKKLRAPTVTSALVKRLRVDIIEGTLVPGQRLKLNELGERYGAGLVALREALSRLVANGLVLATDQKGFSVVGVSREDFLDLIETRVSIDSLALRASIEKGGVEWEAGIQAARHGLAKAGRGNELEERWETSHLSFHEALVAAAGSRRLLEIRRALADETARYRRLSLAFPGPRDILGEHDAIAEAALARDAERACQLLAAHLRLPAEILIAAGFPHIDQNKQL